MTGANIAAREASTKTWLMYLLFLLTWMPTPWVPLRSRIHSCAPAAHHAWKVVTDPNITFIPSYKTLLNQLKFSQPNTAIKFFLTSSGSQAVCFQLIQDFGVCRARGSGVRNSIEWAGIQRVTMQPMKYQMKLLKLLHSLILQDPIVPHHIYDIWSCILLHQIQTDHWTSTK